MYVPAVHVCMREYTLFCPLWLPGHQYWEAGLCFTQHANPPLYQERDVCVWVLLFVCFHFLSAHLNVCVVHPHVCCAVCFYVHLILRFFQTCGHVGVCVRAGGSVDCVWRRLATFMPTYGPWVWDREGAGTRARLGLVGGGNVCVGLWLGSDLANYSDLMNYYSNKSLIKHDESQI